MFPGTQTYKRDLERYQKLCTRMSRLEAQCSAEVSTIYATMYATIAKEMKAYYDDVSEKLEEEELPSWDDRDFTQDFNPQTQPHSDTDTTEDTDASNEPRAKTQMVTDNPYLGDLLLFTRFEPDVYKIKD